MAKPDGRTEVARVTKIYRFERNRKVETEFAGVGDIVAVAGFESVMVGDTYTDPENPRPLPALPIDPPTVSMNFLPNNSPFAGKEGTYSNSTHLAERLRREALSDVALHVVELPAGGGFRVSGRGELHLSIKAETMRRDGYEFQLSCPHVILKEEDGVLLEPCEDVIIDVPDAYAGTVIEKMGRRKGRMQEMTQDAGLTRLRYIIPPHAGEMNNRNNGVLVSTETCTTVAYALFNLQKRGRLFLGPGARVYRGQIIGEHCRDNDLDVNPAKGKKLTNIRAAGCDENVILTPPTAMSLESCISYINDDELVEVTPKSIRLRKRAP
jgi:GTP-binding protein